MTRAQLSMAFAVGVVLGGVVFWYWSKALTIYHRAVKDWRVWRNGWRRLVRTMLWRGLAAAGWAIGGVVFIALILYVLVTGRAGQ